tara:strand:+ start:148 stop:726 length:579 start_codon:yes stop_codon:yes gene_type:complete
MNNNKINNEIFFEVQLIKLMTENPCDEVAAELITIFLKHKIEETKTSRELENYINNFFLNLDDKSVGGRILEVVKKIGRPGYEHKHIAMNTSTWRFIFLGFEISKAYEETAKIFNTNSETTRQSFERKNHDFGKKELCRLGLHVFIIMYNHKLSSKDEKTITEILNESISTQIHKDEIHLRNKYKDFFTYNM